MAVKTIDIPVIGKTKTTWVYAGGAAIAGVVAYAWWTGGGTAEPEPTDLLFDEYGNPVGVSADEYQPPTVTGGGSFGPDADEFSRIPATNIEWSALASDYLMRNGFDPLLTAIALGKYLSRQPLSPSEMGVVQAAVGRYGQPPSGGPWPIQGVTEPPGSSTTPSAIAGVKQTNAAPHGIGWYWNQAKDAKEYEVIIYKGTSSGDREIQRHRTTANKLTVRNLPRSNAPYRIRVRGVNGANYGPWATNVGRTS